MYIPERQEYMFDPDDDGDTDIFDFIILDWLVSGLIDIVSFTFSSLFTFILTVLIIGAALFIWWVV